MTTSKEHISTIYYQNFFKRSLISNITFMIMLIAINTFIEIVDTGIPFSSPIGIVKIFSAYFFLIIIMTLIGYYFNRFKSITLINEDQVSFTKKQLEYLFYQPIKGNKLRYETKVHTFLLISGDVFIQRENNQIIVSGPTKTIKTLKNRLKNKFKQEFQLS